MVGMKRVLVAGSRTWDDYHPIRIVLAGLAEAAALDKPFTVIHGGASGADSIAGYCGAQLADEVLAFPADWARYGNSAGPRRNAQMLAEGQPDELWAFSDDLDVSRGTSDMVRRAISAHLPVYVVSRGRMP